MPPPLKSERQRGAGLLPILLLGGCGAVFLIHRQQQVLVQTHQPP
eukprot:CAMPEP_0119276010 /NCGR_PEP_ID=MMETSP1329-20130426/14708_1 /TAXON_ID=114041 /ORGANISM="Genus nov. species nov., Strain RCC1024" /LENGTH=44 /DNA_ID= /DNA_START= /DNA_END= /DNA_ORIENTATION=